jgi:type IV secretion system protein VirD4
MTVDELAVMDGSKCILQLRGVRPFFSDKYDITKHKNYKYLSDADPKNAFDAGKYLSASLKVKPDEEYEYFEYDFENEEETGSSIQSSVFLPDDAYLPDESVDLEPV